MTLPVLLAHEPTDSEPAELMAQRLRDRGYVVTHLGSILPGSSIVEECSLVLESGGAVIVCGTARTAGSTWAHKLVRAAQARPSGIVIVAQMEEGAYLQGLSFGTEIAKYWIDPAKAIESIVAALQKHTTSANVIVSAESREAAALGAYVGVIVRDLQLMLPEHGYQPIGPMLLPLTRAHAETPAVQVLIPESGGWFGRVWPTVERGALRIIVEPQQSGVVVSPQDVIVTSDARPRVRPAMPTEEHQHSTPVTDYLVVTVPNDLVEHVSYGHWADYLVIALWSKTPNTLRPDHVRVTTEGRLEATTSLSMPFWANAIDRVSYTVQGDSLTVIVRPARRSLRFDANDIVVTNGPLLPSIGDDDLESIRRRQSERVAAIDVIFPKLGDRNISRVSYVIRGNCLHVIFHAAIEATPDFAYSIRLIPATPSNATDLFRVAADEEVSGNFDRVIRLLTSTVAIESNDEHLQLSRMMTLGKAYRMQMEPELAVATFGAAVSAATKLKERRAQREASVQLGRMLRHIGNPYEAIRVLTPVASGNDAWAAEANYYLSFALDQSGDEEGAKTAAHRSEMLAQKHKQPLLQAGALLARAGLLWNSHDYVAVTAHSLDALRLARLASSAFVESAALMWLGLAFHLQGHLSTARSFFTAAMPLLRQWPDADRFGYIAILRFCLGNNRAALTALRRFEQSKLSPGLRRDTNDLLDFVRSTAPGAMDALRPTPDEVT